MICLGQAAAGGAMPSLSYAIVLATIVAGLSSSVLAADLGEFEETVTTPDGGTYRIWVGPTYVNAPVANGLGTVGDSAGFVF